MFLKNGSGGNKAAPASLKGNFHQQATKAEFPFVRSPVLFDIYLCHFPEFGDVHKASVNRPMVCVGIYTDKQGRSVALDMMTLTTRHVTNHTRFDVPIAGQRLDRMTQKDTRIATDAIFTIPNSHDRILRWGPIGTLAKPYVADVMLRRALSLYEQPNPWHICTDRIGSTMRTGIEYDRLNENHMRYHDKVPDLSGSEVPFKHAADNACARKGISWCDLNAIQTLATELHMDKMFGQATITLPRTGTYPHWPQLKSLQGHKNMTLEF